MLSVLIARLREMTLEEADPDEVRLLVRSALDAFPRPPLPDDLLSLSYLLQGVERACEEGRVPVDQLRLILALMPEAEETPGEELERHLREVAAELPESDWYTETYDQVARAVEAWQAGDAMPLLQAMDEVQARLEASWEPYYHSPIAAEEITAETVVGHRLLLEGVQGWFDALECLRLASDGQMDWEEALAPAEAANRLLVAVQKLAVLMERSA